MNMDGSSNDKKSMHGFDGEKELIWLTPTQLRQCFGDDDGDT